MNDFMTYANIKLNEQLLIYYNTYMCTPEKT